jgi:hypothetical protein
VRIDQIYLSLICTSIPIINHLIIVTVEAFTWSSRPWYGLPISVFISGPPIYSLVHSSNIRHLIYSRRRSADMMKSKTTITLSIAAIAAAALLFATGPIVGNQLAYGWHGGGG